MGRFKFNKQRGNQCHYRLIAVSSVFKFGSVTQLYGRVLDGLEALKQRPDAANTFPELIFQSITTAVQTENQPESTEIFFAAVEKTYPCLLHHCAQFISNPELTKTFIDLCSKHKPELFSQKKENGDNILHSFAKNTLLTDKHTAVLLRLFGCLSDHKILDRLLDESNNENQSPRSLALKNPTFSHLLRK